MIILYRRKSICESAVYRQNHVIVSSIFVFVYTRFISLEKQNIAKKPLWIVMSTKAFLVELLTRGNVYQVIQLIDKLPGNEAVDACQGFGLSSLKGTFVAGYSSLILAG